MKCVGLSETRRWFRIRVRSSSSRRQVRTHRFMITFIRGIWTPLRPTVIPASARTVSNGAGGAPFITEPALEAMRVEEAAYRAEGLPVESVHAYRYQLHLWGS
jgi:hypothetical protein